MIHWGFHRWLFLFWLFLILKTSQCLLICVIQYLCALISTAIRDLVNTQTCYGSSFCPPQITVDLSSLLGYDFEIGHEIEISRLKYFVPSFCYGGLVVISALRLMPHVFFWEAQHMEDFFCMNVELAQHSQLKISHGQNDCFCLNCALGFQHRYKSWLTNFAPGTISELFTTGTPARRLLVKKSVSPLYRCSWHQETPSFEVNQDEPTAYGNTSSEWSADHLRTLVLVCLVVFAESPLIVMDALWPSFSLKPGMWLSSRWWMGTQSFLIDTFWPQIGSQHDVPPRWIKGASVMESILWQSAKCWRILALCQLQRTMGLWGELLLGVETRQHAHREAENPAFGGVFLCLKIVSMPSWRSHLLQS